MGQRRQELGTEASQGLGTREWRVEQGLRWLQGSTTEAGWTVVH